MWRFIGAIPKRQTIKPFLDWVYWVLKLHLLRHVLTYGTVQIDFAHFYNAESGKNVQGGLGFSLEVSDVDKLAASNFDDF